jgi:hypothetical protein
VGTGLLPVTSGFGLDGEPDQDFLKPISTGGTGGLNIPVSLMKKMQAEFIHDPCCIHRPGRILFVYKHQ